MKLVSFCCDQQCVQNRYFLSFVLDRVGECRTFSPQMWFGLGSKAPAGLRCLIWTGIIWVQSGWKKSKFISGGDPPDDVLNVERVHFHYQGKKTIKVGVGKGSAFA